MYRFFYRDIIDGNIENVKSHLQQHPEWIDAKVHSARWTPLHVAAKHNHFSIVKYLLESGEQSLDVQDISGLTPMTHAAFRGYHVVTEWLLFFGASCRIASRSGDTPLHIATISNDAQMVELLVGFDPPPIAGPPPLFGTSDLMKIYRAIGDEEIVDDDVMEIRYRIYFARSLLFRLVCVLNKCG